MYTNDQENQLFHSHTVAPIRARSHPAVRVGISHRSFALYRAEDQPTRNFHRPMRINRALGLGLLLLILQFLAGGIWMSLEATVIRTLDVTQTALGAAEAGLEEGLPSLVPQFPATNL